ncbi:MAG: hypothetical protein J6W75_01415 [Bacteroidaceae bacterium]|nr:hypothetical protein [Bacteroidaceae bacterium]
MTNPKLSSLLAIVSFVALSLVSCDNLSCPLENTVESVYGFYATSRTANGTFEPGAAISIGDTLTIYAANRDTILANRLIGKSSVSLPVSYYADVDTLLFVFSDADGRSTSDLVYIHKRNIHHWDAPSCPVHLWHEVTAVASTHNLIDTILISNPHINYDGNENFQIYFYTNLE